MHTSLSMCIYIYIWCACVCEPSQYMYFFLPRLLCLIDRCFCLWPGFQTVFMHGGTGVTLVPVLTNTARCHSDIKGRRPFHVPAVFYPFGFDRHGMGPSREPLHWFFDFCMVSYGFRNLLKLLRPTWYSQSFGCGKSTGSGDGNSANTFGFSWGLKEGRDGLRYYWPSTGRTSSLVFTMCIFLPCLVPPSCQVYMKCFLHDRCIPQHNSRRQFWASLWLMSASTWSHEPLVGSNWEPRLGLWIFHFQSGNSFQ